jgi:hypothetical protein
MDVTLSRCTHAAERVASWIARALQADEDPRTLPMWCRAAAVSVRTLQYACTSVKVSPTACRDLARLLRLATRPLDGAWDPFAQLNADPRTVRQLLRLAGVSGDSSPRDLDAFLARQSLVKCPGVLTALRSRLQSEARSHASRTQVIPGGLPQAAPTRLP